MRTWVPAPVMELMHVYASRWKELRAATSRHAPTIARMTRTEIDGRLVTIEPGTKTIISFSAGRGGPGEAGRWEFWTLMGPAGAVVTRCHEGADPGECFCRMKGLREYGRTWKKSRFAEQLHPATVDELESWMNTHPDYVPHAKFGEIGGVKVRVVKEGRSYRVVSDAPWFRMATLSGMPARSRGIAR